MHLIKWSSASVYLKGRALGICQVWNTQFKTMFGGNTFNWVRFSLYSTKLKQQWPQGNSDCKVMALRQYSNDPKSSQFGIKLIISCEKDHSQVESIQDSCQSSQE